MDYIMLVDQIDSFNYLPKPFSPKVAVEIVGLVRYKCGKITIRVVPSVNKIHSSKWKALRNSRMLSNNQVYHSFADYRQRVFARITARHFPNNCIIKKIDSRKYTYL